MSELPITWCDTKFTEVFDVQGGTQPPKSTFIEMPRDGYIRLLQIRDFGAKPVPTYIPEKKTLKTCEKNDLLIARYGASLGRICTGMEGAYNVALAKLVCPEQIDKAFAKYYLRSDQFQSPLRLLSRSAQNGFNKEDLADFDLSFPPLAEQTRIAQRLDELLAQVDTLKARLDVIPALLKRFRQSVLAAAVSGQLTEEWRLTKQMENIWNKGFFTDFFDIQGGTQPPKSTFIDHPNDGYVQLVQIRDFGDKPVPTFIPDSKSLKKFECDDYLIGRYGASVGRICTGLSGAYNVALVKVLALESVSIYKPFLGVILRAPNFQSSITGFERSAQDGFNKNDLSTIEVVLPSICEQTEIVHRVEQFFTFADQLEAKVASAKSRIDHLTQSILAKAFRGELVPQDPNDEPASELLARIKAQRAAAPKAKRGRKSA